ncbi:hypothetical protein THRCLA_21868 [Thraustotheca clavata]|uniref:Uncharacterized protein n=1 Tax=Thraustotheca clavata TaxID=74557 RepID=A0A1V9ZLH9_9STRA|nr:hypothetical protein THRCLA_21868 [Thraustotheca clavata]
MSLGFLTESALVPSKAKPIKVDSKSLVDLKAIVFHEQERKKATSESTGLRYKRGARSKASSTKNDVNAGIEKRRQRDEEDKLLGDDEKAKKKRSRHMLIEKAKIYDQMARGERPASSQDLLVNFNTKTNHRDHEFTETSKKQTQEDDDSVEITDEFGRTKKISKKSDEYQAYLREKQPADNKNTGSYVVSQWEKTLNVNEKTYLNEIKAQTQVAKLTLADKKQQKELRLQKLKQAFSKESKPQVPQNEPVSKEASEAANDFLSSLL